MDNSAYYKIKIKMFSKTQLAKRTERKTNPELVETLLDCKKAAGKWLDIGKILSGSRRQLPVINLNEINSQTKEGDTVVIAGKVLSLGNIDKKIRIVALGFSESAKEKIKESKGEAASISDDIKKNPKAQGIKFLEINSGRNQDSIK